MATTFVHDGAQVIAEYEAPIFQSQDIGGSTLGGSFSLEGSIAKCEVRGAKLKGERL